MFVAEIIVFHAGMHRLSIFWLSRSCVAYQRKLVVFYTCTQTVLVEGPSRLFLFILKSQSMYFMKLPSFLEEKNYVLHQD
jgi:hypothetical protein